MARRRIKPTGSPQASVVWTAFNRPNIAPASTVKSPSVASGATDLFSLHQSPQPSRTKRMFSTYWNQLQVEREDPRVTNPSPFDRQIARPDIVDRFPDVNENRFNGPVDGPRVKKVVSPNLRKAIPRKDRRESKRWESAQYNPNFQAIWKKQAVNFSFEKAQGRSSPTPFPCPDPPSLISYSQVQSKVPSPDFKRAPAKSISSLLPIHMQNIVSWQALHCLCDQMLEMNGAFKKERKHDRTLSQ